MTSLQLRVLTPDDAIRAATQAEAYAGKVVVVTGGPVDESSPALTPQCMFMLASAIANNRNIVDVKFTGFSFYTGVGFHIAEGLKLSQTLTSVAFWKDKLDDYTAFQITGSLMVIPTLMKLNLGENFLTEDGRNAIEALVMSTKPHVQLKMF
eukprot:TRINITY_DN20631_c0_g1_i1.p1 TRINITY_DN20631_c0_g1~~TRINITY_DN20631_c0_g1_i1.p1  ORF type:complete len:161 (+),score=41.91 TRINITY_DN20631_c0_g1_i1:28-483(+)